MGYAVMPAQAAIHTPKPAPQSRTAQTLSSRAAQALSGCAGYSAKRDSRIPGKDGGSRQVN